MDLSFDTRHARRGDITAIRVIFLTDHASCNIRRKEKGGRK
jgi:hypothetical protein